MIIHMVNGQINITLAKSFVHNPSEFRLNWPMYVNKTRGLRRWPTRETIVLGCNNFNPGSTGIFEFQVRTSELFLTSVPTSKECVHNNKERYILQSWRYPKFCWISSRKYANYQTDRQTKNLNYLEPMYQHIGNASKKFQKYTPSRTGDIPLSNFGKEVSKQTD